jgi:hypothetical protein
MKLLWLLAFAILWIAIPSASAAPPHQYCLEELRREYGNSSDRIQRLYEKTGESACFSLKTHVSKCLDRALLSLISVTDSQQIETYKKGGPLPSISLEDLESSMGHYVNVNKLPGFKDFLERCSHPSKDSGLYKRVVTVGDFSKTCACDLGNDDKCLAYEHVRQMFSCGEAVPMIGSLL